MNKTKENQDLDRGFASVGLNHAFTMVFDSGLGGRGLLDLLFLAPQHSVDQV